MIHASPRGHAAEWDERLQEWLEGGLDAAASSKTQAHLAECAACQATLQRLQQLDGELSRALPQLALDAAFDARILAQIDTIDDAKRVQARRRVEEELQQSLRALARSWRRALLFIIPGLFAGVALAFALNAWLDETGITRKLIMESGGELGSDTSTTVRLLLTAVLGTSVGAAIARWLASVAD